MDFSYDEDQEALRGLARKILEEQLPHDHLKQVRASEERIDREVWRELARANLLGLSLAEEYGGSGLDLLELCILLEEVGRTVAPVPVYPTLVLGALPIAEFGNAAQKKQWLPRVAAGDAFLTACLAESGSGSGASARHDGTGFRLEGERRFVLAAHVAHCLLVPASMEGEKLGIFLVDTRSEGIKLSRTETTDEQYSFDVSFSNARVPDADLLGDPRRGREILEWMRERALLGLCALQAGVAARALEMTAAYTTERKQFDRPIGSFQAVHQRAGDAYVDLMAMRLTLQRALHLLQHGEPAAEELAIAKYWAAEGGARITYAAQHLHGGIGIDLDYPVHRYYLWARQLGIHLGSASQQLARIGEGLAA